MERGFEINSLEKIKKLALENDVPILMDDTLNKIIEVMSNRKKTKSILEIGTAVGYSSICFCNYILDDYGFIDTIERDEERAKQANENIKLINENKETNKKINLIIGDAFEEIQKLDKKYDMIFIDANKGKYPYYLEQSLKHLNANGVIFADNVLYKGYVMSDYNKHKQRTAVTHIREFIKNGMENPDIDFKILEVGDGLAVINFINISMKKS